MEQIYTEEQLVLFLYKETPVPEYFETWDAIQNNPALKSMYLDMKQSFRQLNKINLVPPANVISNILNYSLSTAREASC